MRFCFLVYSSAWGSYDTHQILQWGVAMPLIGVRELRERTAEVLRKVRTEQTEYVITYQGQPVAVLLPIDDKAMEEAIVQASKQNVLGGWEAYARLADQVSQAWPSERRTQDLIDEIRQ